MKGKHDPYCKDDAAYVYEQGRSLRDEQRGIDSWKEDIQSLLNKWKEDIDIAYWQGYNDAMIERNDDV